MFFDTLYPGAHAIADPEGELYQRFSIERGGWRQMFGLPAWLRGIQATLKGHRVNRKIGDPWTLPTILVVEDARIVWEFRGRHAGDHPDVVGLLRRFPSSPA